MRTMMAAGLALAVAAGALAASPVARVGKPAPPFTLKDSAGNTISLPRLRGSIVVLEWMNPECPFWKRNAARGTCRKVAEKYASMGVVWFAVNSTAHLPREQDAWAREAFYLPYQVLDDRAGRVGRAYGAKTTPSVFIVDARGRLAYAGAVDNDPDGAKGTRIVNYVAQAVEELVAGKPVSVPQTKPYGCSVKYAGR